MNFLRRLFLHPVNGRVRSFWRGHFFLFDPKPPPTFGRQAGIRLLIVFLLLEGLLGPRLSLLLWLGFTTPHPEIRVPVLLVLSLVLIRFFARIKLADVGLYSLARWTSTERWYFIQILALANIAFSVLLAPQVMYVVSHAALWGSAFGMIAVSLMWGFYQEVIYRGLLQTELVRRWKKVPGILVSNLIYTFGPLHFYYFQTARENPAYLWMFAATFGIGLFFALLYERSGNLWMVGIFHGIGNAYLVGLREAAALVPQS